LWSKGGSNTASLRPETSPETVPISEKQALSSSRNVASPETFRHGSQRPEPEPDPVEKALAKALAEASEAKQWDVVAALAKELEARRLAHAGNVVSHADRRRK
jgi:hypothetical protein